MSELSDFDLVVLYEDSIEEMLAVAEWEIMGEQNVFALSQILAAVNASLDREGRDRIAMPQALHPRLNKYARNGMFKGRGGAEGRPPDNFLGALVKQTRLADVGEFACKRKEERLNNSRVLLEEAGRTDSLATRDKLLRQAEKEGIHATGANSAEEFAIKDAIEYAEKQYGVKFKYSGTRTAMSKWQLGALPIEVWGPEAVKQKKIKSRLNL